MFKNKMKEFKYDVIELIEGVRDRPCLWDKTIENYKDRVERRTAWEEIFNMLEANYEVMTPEDKRITGEQIINKWTNIRDTFVKTLKTKMGRPKRRYILYDHLKFLTKIVPEQELIKEFNEEPDMLMKEELVPETSYGSRKRSKRRDFDELKCNEDDADVSFGSKKKSKKHVSNEESHDSKDHRKKSKLDFTDDAIDDTAEEELVHSVEMNDLRVMNEDEAFFASLLPTVVTYNEDEKLEFRIEVLSVMRKIRDKRKWTSDD